MLSTLRLSGPRSRSELVEHLGLTRSAVGSLIGELVGAGLVAETGPARGGQRGRPSATAAIDTTQVAALGIEIGVDELAVAVVDLAGEIIDTARISTERGQSDVAATVAAATDLVRLLGYANGSVGSRRIIGAGVAVAGLVRSADGVVVAAPNLGWSDVALSQAVTEALDGIDHVSVGNEGDLGALAESRFGAGVAAGTMLYVAGEVGVGGGVIVDDQPLGGRSGFAGEVGHIPVNPAGDECRCGSIGCWETEVGERALLARAGRDPDGGVRALHRLVRDAERGDSDVLDAIAEHGGWTAIGIAGLINVFDPDLVVLGGVFSDLWPHIEPVITSELNRSSLGGHDRSAVVARGHLGTSARLIGAAELALQSLLADPATR